MNKKIFYTCLLFLLGLLGLLGFFSQSRVFADGEQIPTNRIKQGFTIAPVPLNLEGKNPSLLQGS
jgi:hypothetical protein